MSKQEWGQHKLRGDRVVVPVCTAPDAASSRLRDKAELLQSDRPHPCLNIQSPGVAAVGYKRTHIALGLAGGEKTPIRSLVLCPAMCLVPHLGLK